MKRIDSINARPNTNGVGKTGFHDNADLSGQDATYLTPEWLNVLQEELCNLLEMNGIALNSGVRDQLYQLLATNDDINALAAAVQQLINNEAQIRANNDNALSDRVTTLENAPAQDISGKFDKAGGTISGNVQIGSNDEPRSLSVSAAFIGTFLKETNGYTSLPNGIIMQWGIINGVDFSSTIFPISFPTACLSLTISELSTNETSKTINYKNLTKTGFDQTSWAGTELVGTIGRYIAVGY